MATTPRQSAPAETLTPVPSHEDELLVLERVTRSYGATVAIGSVTLRVGREAVCVLHGANGSGKTTLLRLAAGVLAPTTGRRHARGSALYLRSGDGIRDAQSVRQAVAFAAAATGADPDVDAVLESVGLAGLADVSATALSAGQRARVSLAVATACRSAIVCLDEATAHLDDDGRAVASQVVRGLAARGAAALVATHDTTFLSGVADARLHLRDGLVQVAAW